MEQIIYHEQKLDAKKREVIEKNTQAKAVISGSFQELRQRIDAKEREML